MKTTIRLEATLVTPPHLEEPGINSENFLDELFACVRQTLRKHGLLDGVDDHQVVLRERYSQTRHSAGTVHQNIDRSIVSRLM
jgi:glycerol-3-phosphate O-acyltransferase